MQVLAGQTGGFCKTLAHWAWALPFSHTQVQAASADETPSSRTAERSKSACMDAIISDRSWQKTGAALKIAAGKRRFLRPM
jgi:hypothetical protein